MKTKISKDYREGHDTRHVRADARGVDSGRRLQGDASTAQQVYFDDRINGDSAKEWGGSGTMKTKNPRSEAAQREAIRNRDSLFFDVTVGPRSVVVTAHELVSCSDEPVAVFDLRDTYRKRAALTGITKKIRKAIQPKAKRGGRK